MERGYIAISLKCSVDKQNKKKNKTVVTQQRCQLILITNSEWQTKTA